MTSAAAVPKTRRWRWGVAACGAVGLLAVGGMLLRSAQARRDRQGALDAARAGAFARAEPALRTALARDPADAEAAEALARGYLQAKNLTEAEAHLDRWVALRPTDPEPVGLRMGLYWHRKHFDRAFADALRLLELRPVDAEVRWEVLRVAYSAGEFAKAEELCLAGLRDGERRYRVPLAEVRRARGNPAGAAAVLDEVLRDNPNDVPALITRAELFNEAGEPEKAAPLMRQVIRLDPQRRLSAGYQLSVILERAGRPDEAREVLAEVRRLQDVANADDAAQSQPNNPEVRVRLGTSLLAAGHEAAGLRHLRAALAIDPSYRPAHTALAEYYEAHGQPALAAEHRRRANTPP